MSARPHEGRGGSGILLWTVPAFRGVLTATIEDTPGNNEDEHFNHRGNELGGGDHGAGSTDCRVTAGGHIAVRDRFTAVFPGT